jgi:hypothetical protein
MKSIVFFSYIYFSYIYFSFNFFLYLLFSIYEKFSNKIINKMEYLIVKRVRDQQP